MKVQRAALRAPRGQMPTACPREPLVNKVRCASLGGGPQAMSVCIVEGRQQRRWPRAAATRRELSRAIIAVLKYRYETCGSITHAQPHGSCWALPSSVWRRLHGPECGRYRRCSAFLTRAPALGTIHTGIAFVVLGA